MGRLERRRNSKPNLLRESTDTLNQILIRRLIACYKLSNSWDHFKRVVVIAAEEEIKVHVFLGVMHLEFHDMHVNLPKKK